MNVVTLRCHVWARDAQVSPAATVTVSEHGMCGVTSQAASAAYKQIQETRFDHSLGANIENLMVMVSRKQDAQRQRVLPGGPSFLPKNEHAGSGLRAKGTAL